MDAIQSISYQELLQLLAEGDRQLLLLDVRPQEEFEAG
jgi:hypothetical protein